MHAPLRAFATCVVLLGIAGAVTPADAQLDRLKRKAQEVKEKLGEKDKPAKPDAKKAEGEASEPTASADASKQKPGEGAWANYDFVPGDRVLFADDLSRDRVGNFPQRWEFAGGSAEVVDWQGRRFLRATEYAAFAVVLPETLPERFTIEFETTVPWNGVYVHTAPASDFLPGVNQSAIEGDYFVVSGSEVGIRRKETMKPVSFKDPREALAAVAGDDGEFTDELVNVRIQVDGRYAKLYVNEVRMVNIPAADLGRADRVWFQIEPYDGTPVFLTNISVNAGGSELYDALVADGRVATQGIYFDVNSDRIRPESTPTLTQIGEMLTQHADLSLTIEGHTDATGQAAANQTLSEKRAAAVKAYLVANHGIDAARLESVGLGATKPVASNDTGEGRQQNRRVELVKK